MIISSCFNLITNELPLNTTSLIVVKWYTIHIHYTKTDHHVRWCSFNGEHQHVDHIIHMTRVQPFGFRCPEAMSVHARLVKQTQVFRVCNMAYTRCMWTLSLSHPIITRCFKTTNCSNGAYEGRTLYYLDINVRDHLIMLPSRSKQNKMHKGLTSHAIHMWYDMALLSLRLWSSSPKHGHDLHHLRAWSPSSSA